MLWSEIFLSRVGILSVFYRLYQKSFFCGQPRWQPLVNTSPVSQFSENVNSFNVLANALGPLKNSHFGHLSYKTLS